MTYFPHVAALWTHAARRAQLTARQLGYTRRVDKLPEQEHTEQVLEKALRAQSRETLKVLKQNLLTLSGHGHAQIGGPTQTALSDKLYIDRQEMLAEVDKLIAEANEKRPSARPRRKR
jgi:hypothetical protein